MLADPRAAWRLRSGQAGPGRLALLSFLIVLAGATAGLGLALLVPLVKSLALRLLLRAPRLILLDEPASALDAARSGSWRPPPD